MSLKSLSIVIICLAATTGYVLCLASAHSWIAELATHWRLHMGIASLFFALLFLISGQLFPASWMALLVAGFLLPAFSAFAPAPLPKTVVKDRITLLHFNIKYGNNDFASKSVPWIIAQNADIVVLHEVNKVRALDLAKLKAHYPWSRVEINQGRDAFGKAIFSRLPVKEYRNTPTKERWNTYAYLSLVLPSGKPLHLYELHPPPPVTTAFADQRKKELALIAKVLSEDKTAYRLLVGDLNSTIHSPYFKEILNRAGLHAAQQGYRMEGTWPTAMPQPLRIGIDNLLASSPIVIESREVGPDLGSDHLPVVNKLVFYD